MSNINASNPWKRMDVLLLQVSEKGFCSSDVPKEIIIISEKPLKHELYENEILRKLYDPEKVNKKMAHKLLLDNRWVEVIKDPLLDGRLEVIIKREPSMALLTFSEAYNIINKLQKMLGLDLQWRRPFPRGSC